MKLKIPREVRLEMKKKKLENAFKVVENTEIFWRDKVTKVKDVFQNEISYLKKRIAFVQIVKREYFPKTITELKKVISLDENKLVEKLMRDFHDEHFTAIKILQKIFLQDTIQNMYQDTIQIICKDEFEIIYNEIKLFIKFYYFYQTQPDLFNNQIIN